MTNKKMQINKEVALRLWNAQFGRTDKTTDFAGREIAKAAYNDRNSKFCWNVDHIYPQKLGGKTVDSNLICCHMLTNDEKADNYPAFTANGKKFIIKKVQNHYEIVELKDKDEDAGNGKEETDDRVNFFDAAAGLEFFDKCGEPGWVGFVKILVSLKYDNKQNIAGELYAFFKKILGCPAYTGGDLEFVDLPRITYGNEFEYKLFDFKVEQQSFVQNMLDNCVLLNTYLQYFRNKNKIDNFKIYCGLRKYDNEFFASRAEERDFNVRFLNNAITINDLVKINTDAKDKSLKESNGCFEYDYIYTKLRDDLNKQ
ncbi:MAG: HNH endonuclease [Clostridia bacterium]|nr:HNH endonuclease [Clostridia bacterium]